MSAMRSRCFLLIALGGLLCHDAAAMRVMDVMGVKKPVQNTYSYSTMWFDQKIDHYGFVESGSFKQRVLINDSYWDPDTKGPMFVYTGNEGDIEAFAQNSGFMWDAAPQFGALLVFIEHRFYGQSLPFGANSSQPQPHFVGYLSSEQALADFAHVIVSMKQSIVGAADVPVIAFGGSYGGMLAAWLRIKFPHVCDGAIAASAPVAQFSAPCDAFGRIVTADYSKHGDACSGTIRSSWKAIDTLSASAEGLKNLSQVFRLCKPLVHQDNATSLKSYLTDLWTNLAMMDYPYPTDFLAPLPGHPIEYACARISANLEANMTANQTLWAVAQGAQVFYNYSGSTTCLDLQHKDDIGADMWEYQACSEMVMPFCYDGVNDMFQKAPFNLSQLTADCEAKWRVSPRPHMADIMYGSKKLEAASNIVFSNGLLDPWSSGGILKSISKSVVSLLIPEGAHHLDLRGAHPADPVSVITARKMEKQYIRKFIMSAKKRKSIRPSGPDLNSIML